MVSALVQVSVREIPCTDLSDDPKYQRIEDRLGKGWTDLEILTWIQKHFLVTPNYTLRLVKNKYGNDMWLVTRHPQNCDRGDDASVDDKCRSVCRFSIRLEWRSPPWLVMHSDPSMEDHVLSLHWGTLFDGTRKAWEMDKDKTNAYVQMAVSMDIPGCHLYARNLVADAARFLVDWGNLQNGKSTVITPLRVWRQTPGIDIAFNAHKKRRASPPRSCRSNMQRNWRWPTKVAKGTHGASTLSTNAPARFSVCLGSHRS